MSETSEKKKKKKKKQENLCSDVVHSSINSRLSSISIGCFRPDTGHIRGKGGKFPFIPNAHVD